MSERPHRDLVLVGGGHAHVQVIRRFMMRPIPDVRLVVVLDRSEAVYSWMVPSFVAGEVALPELEIDVLPLARRAGARVVLAPATGLEPESHRLRVAGRPDLHYDLLSFDVGSTVRGLTLPGASEHALATRPIRSFVDRLESRLAAARERRGDEPLRLVVVGGGAAGVELVFTLEARLRAAGAPAELALVSDARVLLPGSSARLSRAVAREAKRRGVALRLGARVSQVTPDALELVGEPELVPCDVAVWATGAAPVALLQALPLPKDEAGFLVVRDTLQSPASDDIFAVGDCSALEAHPWVPKAGVHAVRQGPTLDANLRARLAGRSLRAHRPQRDFLALLNLGDGRAIGGKWGASLKGRAIWVLKDRIDRRFMRRFQVLGPEGEALRSFPAMEGEEMVCGGCAAKVGPDGLARALARLDDAPPDPEVVLGLDRPDDAAAVRRPGGGLSLATIDGFRAFCDDPWLVGRVAAVNAASDVFAKGGRPRHALAWVHVPASEPRGGEDTLFQVMAGVRAALDPLGITLLGGHSTTGDELLVGISIQGELDDEAALLPLGGLRPGDRLILSKALGSGVVLAADMQGLARGPWVAAVHTAMQRANDQAARVARGCAASASTDISGFGLAGHLSEMLRASGVAAELDIDALPWLPGARELLTDGLRSTFHAQNEGAVATLLDAGAHPVAAALLVDPQTSGGLLFGVSEEHAERTVLALREAGDLNAAVIGRVTEGTPRITLRGSTAERKPST